MNKLALITCFFVILGVTSANPAVRESRHAVPVGMINGMILVDDDMVDTSSMLPERIATPTVVAAHNAGAVLVPSFTPDQQTEEQRLTIALGGRPYGGYGGRPYGGYYGGRPWNSQGRPWGPYGRPWGPYVPYRPWGPY